MQIMCKKKEIKILSLFLQNLHSVLLKELKRPYMLFLCKLPLVVTKTYHGE